MYTIQLLYYCSKEDPSKELTVVLLADHHLLQLPLEALGLLRDNKCVVGVSRDLSLQMLAYRILSMKEAANTGERIGWKIK